MFRDQSVPQQEIKILRVIERRLETLTYEKSSNNCSLTLRERPKKRINGTTSPGQFLDTHRRPAVGLSLSPGTLLSEVLRNKTVVGTLNRTYV